MNTAAIVISNSVKSEIESKSIYLDPRRFTLNLVALTHDNVFPHVQRNPLTMFNENAKEVELFYLKKRMTYLLSLEE